MSETIELAPDGFVFCGRKGDLMLYLTHICVDGDEDAALYIRNPHRKVPTTNPITGEAADGCPAYLIPYRDFWVFRPDDRDRGKHHDYADMLARLDNAAQVLYGMVTPQYAYRIHDAILEFADDVKDLRPPNGVTKEAWLQQMADSGITLKVNGQAIN